LKSDYGLNKTYFTFFGKFSDLTSIQKETIPLVLKKNNSLIIAPTASGKTEAIMAPVCEVLLSNIKREKNQLKVLYIVPTKALVSDILKRLKDKIEILGLTLGGRTGDTRSFKKNDPQDILITTPETTDSLISTDPELFSNLEFLIIDELHFLDNTYRGDQLRILMNRIQNNLKNKNLGVYGISATVNSPDQVMNRYIKDGVIVKNSNNSREIIFIPVDSRDKKYLIKLKKFVREKKIQKLLVFCNSKKETIQFCSELKEVFLEDKSRIFEHHASIDLKIRKEIEQELASNRFSICVCTTTLEIGIDIGNIDAIILKKPPLTVSSFLQRIGRGNRRTNKTRCLGIYDNDDEKNQFEQMKNDAINGNIEFYEYIPDISVCVQQILSLAFQHYNQIKLGLDEKKIVDILKPFNFKDSVILDIIEHLIFEEELIEKKKIHENFLIFPSEKMQNTFLEKPFKRIRINSNIPERYNDVQVFDERGTKIGTIAPPENIESFNLASKKWKVQNYSGNKIVVQQTSNTMGIPSFNNSKFGHFHYTLPKKYQNISKITEWLN
jgi:ATP-dependent helicase Lhr and Lhr-like helicase